MNQKHHTLLYKPQFYFQMNYNKHLLVDFAIHFHFKT